jgi:type I restriction enzyme S subunit
MVPEGWKDARLGDLMEFKNGLNTEKENYGSGTKFVNVMDVFRNDRLHEQNIMGSVQVNAKQLFDYSVRYGDVLFNRTSETFDEIAMSSVYLDSKEITFGGFVIRGRPKSENLFPDFSVFCFQSWQVRKELIRRGQGAVRANIGQKDLCKVPIVIPTLPEQKKIARILSTWDRAIEVAEKLLSNSQQQKKSLMQQLLTGKKRFPGFSGEWKNTNLSKIASVIMGSSPKSEAYNDENMGLPLLQGNADIKNRLSSPRIFTSQITKECMIGDVLLSVRAPVGEISRSIHNACIGRGIAAIQAKSGICQDFIYQWFLYFEPKWERLSQGSTFESVNSNDIKSLPMEIPSFEEQQKIVSVLFAADKEIEALQQKLECLKQEKKALMQQLLTGKRRVKVDEKEISQKEAVHA